MRAFTLHYLSDCTTFLSNGALRRECAININRPTACHDFRQVIPSKEPVKSWECRKMYVPLMPNFLMFGATLKSDKIPQAFSITSTATATDDVQSFDVETAKTYSIYLRLVWKQLYLFAVRTCRGMTGCPHQHRQLRTYKPFTIKFYACLRHSKCFLMIYWS